LRADHRGHRREPEVKRALFRQLEGLCGEHCILASNTSSLSITSIAARLEHPNRLLGLHFFNPAPSWRWWKSFPAWPAIRPWPSACTTPPRPGAKPVHTRSTPGFIVNRVARPFYAESLRLLQEGAADCPPRCADARGRWFLPWARSS
jgi:3-hydroxybutyryl-CoA dehydrogenase